MARLTVATVKQPTDAEGADDTSLVAAAAGGDRRAFEALYRKHMPGVYRRLTGILGPVTERDDVLQQVFIQLHRALPRFRGEARFSTFLHRIVVNVASEHLQRHRRERGRLSPLDERELDVLEAPTVSPETDAERRQSVTRILAHLAALRPKKRVAFILVDVEGLSLEEAGEIVDASADTVKQRVLAARRELGARMARAARREEAT